MNSKKGKSPSLQFKIGRYLLIFSAFVIAVIAIFQLVLLEPMYEQSKTDEVIDVAERISDELNSAYLNEHIYQVQQQTDTCVMVYLADTASWRFEASDNQGCLLYRLTPSSLGSLIAGAGRSADGTYMVKEKAENIYPEKQNRDFLHIIYTKIVNRNGRDAIVMVSAGVSPISSTLATLRKQLILIAVLILLAVGVLTMTMYREIARPLNRITASAKTLPSGSFALDPATSRYAEAEELNSTLSQAAQDIHKADKAKRDLISNVSHDLRTPLTMISGYGEMMMDLPDEKTDENIQVIVDESRRLNALVNDLLDLSRLQDGRIVLECENFDLSALISEQMRKYEVYAVRDDYHIEQIIAEGLMIHADRRRVEQVFNNFMTNAINYSGERKEITVRVYSVNGSVHTEVSDCGEGISKDDIANVWDRYYKVDKTHVRAVQGSGIGLSICKEILELHHAGYGVSSEVGKGSTFYFIFPEAKAEAERA